MQVDIKRVTDKFIEVPLPYYATENSAGMDIHATIEEEIIIEPSQVRMIPTNIAIALPNGYECQVRSRSGLAAKSGIFCLNSPGTIDADYRGEINVIVANFGKTNFTIKNGDRIAQLVIAKYEQVSWQLKTELSDTERGAAGFGSTGV
jgi:dUTP pyrophosphatase